MGGRTKATRLSNTKRQEVDWKERRERNQLHGTGILAILSLLVLSPAPPPSKMKVIVTSRKEGGMKVRGRGVEGGRAVVTLASGVAISGDVWVSSLLSR